MTTQLRARLSKLVVMRSSVAILLSIVVLFVGVTAISDAALNAEDTAVQNGTNQSASAYNMTTEVFGGLTEAAAPGLVWFGIGAIILVALGFLVYAGSSGR